MRALSNACSAGSTQLHFSTSFGEPLEGVTYRLRDGRGDTYVGSTTTDGRGVMLSSNLEIGSAKQERTWRLPAPGHVQIDIRRDDGSWKHIGSFCHHAHQHSNIVITANATAFPFEVEIA
ncbi:hypothetical protein [Stenotrophomonas maltophilia]|uniref:hypothetical protein n=1 Tax=Stenotrophomonas maltophilia TaxID=40324 RepID=UPI0015E02D22|nr:hypothetical protein [Stenotrophomonas maltophilia]